MSEKYGIWVLIKLNEVAILCVKSGEFMVFPTLLYETLVETGEKEKYQEVLGNTSSMFTLAFAIGGVIGGILVFWSFTLLMWVSVLPQLLCLGVSFLIIEPPVQSLLFLRFSSG